MSSICAVGVGIGTIRIEHNERFGLVIAKPIESQDKKVGNFSTNSTNLTRLIYYYVTAN